MKALKIGDLTATTPIVQGGMGVGVSLSRLASAVANEGGTLIKAEWITDMYSAVQMRGVVIGF